MEIISKTANGGTKKFSLDALALEHELRANIEGDVQFDKGTRALYAAAGGNYRQVPIGVVVPRTERDIVNIIATCRRYSAPVLARGGGTSLAGQACNVAAVIDVSQYLRNIFHLDPAAKLARVQPGVILDDLRNRAEQHHLTFAPDPSTHTHCTLGGMIGNNSCGVHSVMGGKTEENTLELDVLLYDGTRMQLRAYSEEERIAVIRRGGRQGEIFAQLTALRDEYRKLIREKYPKIPRRVSGYNLPSLLPE